MGFDEKPGPSRYRGYRAATVVALTIGTARPHPRHRVWRGNLYNRSSMAGEEPIPKYGDNPRAATGNHAGPAASLWSWLQNGLPAWRAGRGRKLQPRSGTDSGYSESLRREVRRAIRSLRARPRV